jgi:V8-like Glu-specific endopeptidase
MDGDPLIRKAVLGLAAATTLVAAPAVQASPVSSSDAVVHDLAVTAEQRAAVLDYWTPERIAAMESDPPEPGKPLVESADGASWAPGTLTDRTIGRLFFVDHDGGDASCTATLVPSGSRSVAVTAGHCAHTFNLIGEDPKWATNLLFVPGFRDNTRPFGAFPVRTVVAHRTWIQDDQQSRHDQAFLVFNERMSVATQAIAFDQKPGVAVQEFGYPRAARQEGHKGRPEFIGMRIARCYGTAVEDLGTPDWPGEGNWGVPCDMGGGSSGGPRMAQFTEKAGLGAVVGVDTQSAYIAADGKGCPFGDPACTRHLVGPQFSSAITRPLYLKAVSI